MEHWFCLTLVLNHTLPAHLLNGYRCKKPSNESTSPPSLASCHPSPFRDCFWYWVANSFFFSSFFGSFFRVPLSLQRTAKKHFRIASSTAIKLLVLLPPSLLPLQPLVPILRRRRQRLLRLPLQPQPSSYWKIKWESSYCQLGCSFRLGRCGLEVFSKHLNLEFFLRVKTGMFFMRNWKKQRTYILGFV